MLLLSRRVGERITIGDGIVLTMLEVNARQVRLGIEAPVSVPILREELKGTPARQRGARPLATCQVGPE